jgi:5-methylcytosine-specific restriction endonuclease McrA
MPKCKRCGVVGTTQGWGRYARNGRLKVLCPCCDQQVDPRKAAAKAAGYPHWSRTPEYKRLQREAEAAKQGRKLEAYVPQAERNRRGRMLQVERLADRIRARWAAEWLKPFQKSSAELYWDDPDYREKQKARFRESYRRRRAQEIQRVLAYKQANADRNRLWTATRLRRQADGSDGTATPERIAQLKSEATYCAYCGRVLNEKQTDHMIPLVLGGAHSLRNIVIVCPRCNGRKARLSYEEWIERVEPQHRARVIALSQKRYAAVVA